MKKLIITLLSIGLFSGIFSACTADPGVNESSTGNTTLENSGMENTSERKTSDSGEGNTLAEIEGSEAQYYPNAVEGYKTAHNYIFEFWFDLPEDWKAVDKSQNGDGYFIIPDAADMDIRVYGLIKDSDEEEYYSKLSGKNGTIEDVTFNDGAAGKRIENSSSRVYFVRLDVDSYICFYVNYEKNPGWYEANTEELERIALSLRTRMEGPKLDSGSNKISIDDLKLGEIYIDMPYQNVKNEMKAGLADESTDDIGGITLFYDDGTEIYIIDDTVYTMNVISDAYPTPKGLKVGDHKDRVIELYGQPDNTTEEGRWGYTYDGYELFTVIFENEKVSQLQIDMVR